MGHQIKIPFYKYIIKISEIHSQNIFDWLYARTCIQLNKQSKRCEYDCGDQVKSEVKEQLKSILDEKLIDKIAQNLNKQFLEDSIQETVVSQDTFDDREYVIYQDGISGTLLPITNDQDKIFSFDKSAEKCVNPFKINSADIDSINQIKNIISEFLEKNSCDAMSIDPQRIIIDIVKIEEKPVYTDIDFVIDNNEINIVSELNLDKYYNTIWLERLQNSKNEQVVSIISELEKKIEEASASFNKAKTENKRFAQKFHLKNTKLDEIYQESLILFPEEEISNKLKEAAGTTWTNFACKQLLGDTISKIASKITLEKPQIVIEENIKKDIASNRCFYNSIERTFRDIVDIKSGRLHFKTNSKAIFTLICMYAPCFDEIEAEMNYYSFYSDVDRINGIRNNATHNDRDKNVVEMTKSELIETFNRICKFLIKLYKKQNDLGD